jgi:Mannosylglycerate hydrolase MGH1-like glycoside hydrolase domain/Glycosyl hydrolase family 65, C-terminal domain
MSETRAKRLSTGTHTAAQQGLRRVLGTVTVAGTVLGLLLGASGLPARAAAPGEVEGFELTSGVPACDQAYQKARRVIADDVKDGKFLAGQNWAQVWTRDTSYSVELACALLHPEVSKTTLLGLTQDAPGIGECWYQDKCGHFGGWPNLTDAIVGASGAWSLYLVTGDRDLLEPIYQRTLRSLERAERDAFNPRLGLFTGCASFMESNSGYPKAYAMKGEMVAKTCALSTCLLYYRGYLVAAQAGQALHQDVRPLRRKAARLKAAINAHFWLPDKGYYAYFLDESGAPNPRMEGLGEAFAILTGVANPTRARQILQATPTTPWGFPCLWPQFEEWRDYRRDFAHYYHNGMIWPFVEGYWAWAASRQGDVQTFGRELQALIKLSEKNNTFMEFYRPEDGAPDGSPRQLWSASGFLSMIYHGLFGMDFETNGIRFAPVVPPGFQTLTLSNVKYRSATLRIVVKGHGTAIEQFKLDGQARREPFLDAGLEGPHELEILLR